MNSRLNLGGFSVPQNREIQSNNPWIPVTPQQPVPVRPNATLSNTDGSLPGSSSWWELADLQNGYLEEMPSAGRSVQNLIQSGESVQMPPSYGRSIHNLVQSEKPVQMPSYGIPVQNLIPNVKSQQIGANIQNSGMQQTPSNGMPLGSLIQNGRLGHNDASIQDGHWQELPNYGRAIENLIQNRTPGQTEPNFQDSYLQEMFSYCIPVENSIQSKSSVQNEANIQDSYLQQMLSYDRSLQNNTPCRESVQSGEDFSFNADINDSNQMNGPIPTSFTELLNMEGTDWGQGPISGILASENAAFMPLAKEIPSRPMTKDNIFLNLDSPAAPSSHRGFNSRRTLSDQNGVSGAMPEPSRPMYDLNSLPGIEADDPQIVNNSIQFAPPTPEQAKLGNNQLIEVLDSVVDDNQGKQKQLVLFSKNEASSNQSDELLQSIVDSSRKKDTATEREQGIDLNKTPQLKPPKRRKHRPKVVVEGKPKRSKTSRSSEKPRSKENHSGKRKYVRKKGIKESGNQQPAVMNETTDDKVRTAGKSCRRALNFDVEKTTSLNFDVEKTTAASRQSGKEIEQKVTTDYGVNVSPQSAESSNLCNIWSDPLIGLQKKSTTEHQQVKKHNFTSFMDERRAADHFSLEKWATSTCPLASHTGKEIDARVTTKLVTIASDINWPNSLKNIQKAMQQYDYIGGQMAHERGGNLGNLTRSSQLVTESITKSIPAAPSNSNITRITKRDHNAIEQADLNMNSSSSSYLLQRMFQVDECQNVNRGVLEANKKKKIEKRPSAENHGMQSFVPPVLSYSKQQCRQYWNNELRNGVISGISQPYAGSVNSSEITSHSRHLSNQCLELVPLAHYTNTSAAHHQNADRKEESSSLTQEAHIASQQATQNHSLMIVGVPEPNKLMKHHILLRTEVSASTKRKSGRTKKHLQHKNKDIIHEKQYSVGKEKGSESTIELMEPISIDGIIEKLKVLNLSEQSHELMKPTENAIVLYNGDGRIVPYENKRRKPRPKVDLDPETNRMWNLLMGKEASEGYQGNGMEKENWWRNEREVFRGRANSFIARMHLVQGDRRFSPWKGSVVDSVIGVFLTQNVSDHLSSSAFMLLAARFPVGSRNNRTSNRYVEGVLVEQQEGIMMNPTDIIRYRPNIQPICNSSSVECWRDGAASGIQRTNLFVSQGHGGEEDVISSQESFECSAVEGNGAFRSYSGSNSESEDFSISVKSKMTNVFNLNSSTPKEKYINDSYSHLNRSTLAYQTPKNRFQQHEDKAYNNQNPSLDRTRKTNTSPSSSHLIGSGNIVLFPPALSGQHNLQLTLDSTISKAGGYDALTEESISSWPTASRSTKFKEVNHTVDQTRKQPGSKDKSRVHPQGLLHYEETLSSQCIVSSRNIMQQQNDCHLSIDAVNSQPTFNNDQCQMKFFFHPDANHPDVADRQFDLAQYASTNPNHIQTVTGESTPEMSQNYPANNIVHPTSEVPNRSSVEINNREATITRATATAEKGKLKIDSKNKINWDNLRKEVQHAHGKKERSRDAMDSIDYEAIRKSSISEISAVIKERGMNNMLAERIKEFLNRLVMEHGSIDLEWLRDVPPDQAKDYLLSIRGLGLKSVECVRLLTLHRVAFPVDTNVGRIAVRLGWVPLQPLPEELQLHLLELYPVLESIQKYLWPRLCKLDQQTLYELHYQLITFGKVFCTKTRPNCNACPMRGECRHFASAFASARLALPGPEENRMVASEAPIVYSNPSIAINAAPMTPLEDHSFNRAVTMCSSEPIVEHPASPEKNYTAAPDSDIEDIEDALCEEEEQIPIIRLDMDEFSENLQSYMQGNMELQEGDLSKALVALSEQAASIPAQKLKNVTRLRTEHQVYELPDDHPLLEGMDKREPDDPSPYLLAIWAPGETANSTESAQMGCQDSEPLCNEETCCRCNSIQEANSQTIRGTLLIPCRTAMRGSFPLNGTYFQVNEMFADHASSINPICVPRESIWNLRRRTVFFGSSVSSIFRGLSTEQIQYCFWRGFVCVRGFDQETRAPRPLAKRLHTPPSKLVKTNRGRRA